jgi:hypothetical protein
MVFPFIFVLTSVASTGYPVTFLLNKITPLGELKKKKKINVVQQITM